MIMSKCAWNTVLVRTGLYHYWKYDDMSVNKNELANECHSSIALRKWKKFADFCENEPC